VFRQLAHCPDVTLLSAFGQASKLKTLDHSLSQFGHGYTSKERLNSLLSWTESGGLFSEV
jgi:hypothetical protein